MPDDAPVILFAGGGTGGHLFPGIAVAQALVGILPRAKPLFLCTSREIDRTILAPTGFEFAPQPIVPPHRSIPGLLRFWRSWRETAALIRRVLAERKPAAILGLGGYGAGVAVKLAARRGIPAALLNQDVIPGRANHYLMRYVEAVFCQFAATSLHVPASQRPKLQVTGCPIRQEMAQVITAGIDRTAAVGRLGLNPKLRTLVITGASQGAATINEAILQTLSAMGLQGWQVLHLAGKDHAATVRQEYQRLGIGASVVDFTPAMADVWSVTDLAVGRAGASTVAELTAFGIPSILMPYPFHRDMHQRENARVLEEVGAAVLVDDARDARVNAGRLRPVMEPLLLDESRRASMAQAAATLGKPRAAEAVASLLAELAARP